MCYEESVKYANKRRTFGKKLIEHPVIRMKLAHMARQIVVADIDDGDQCLRLFKSNSTVGWLIFGGLVLGSVVAAI